MVVSAANSAARKRPRTSGQPRAVEDQTAAVTGPGLRDAGQNGSEESADADASPAAVSLGDGVPVVNNADPDNADPEDDEFGELDADDADIPASERLFGEHILFVAGE